jgi:hypothetical protein
MLPSDLDDVFVAYVGQANPKSNEDLKHYLRRYPQYREEIIEFTANWRALAILETVLPPPETDPAAERRLMRHAKTHLRALQRRCWGGRRFS